MSRRDKAYELAQIVARALGKSVAELDAATREGLTSDIEQWLRDNEPAKHWSSW